MSSVSDIRKGANGRANGHADHNLLWALPVIFCLAGGLHTMTSHADSSGILAR
jgi:hypothetical protein